MSTGTFYNTEITLKNWFPLFILTASCFLIFSEACLHACFFFTFGSCGKSEDYLECGTFQENLTFHSSGIVYQNIIFNML